MHLKESMPLFTDEKFTSGTYEIENEWNEIKAFRILNIK